MSAIVLLSNKECAEVVCAKECNCPILTDRGLSDDFKKEKITLLKSLEIQTSTVGVTDK